MSSSELLRQRSSVVTKSCTCSVTCDGDCCSDTHDHHHEHGHTHAHSAAAHSDVSTKVIQADAGTLLTWSVTGLDCPNCARELQEAVKEIDGVIDAQLTYATSTLKVVCDPKLTKKTVLARLLALVRSMGYDLKLSDDEVAALEDKPSWWQQHRESVLMGGSGTALAFGLIVEYALRNEQLAIPLYVLSALLGLVFVAPMAFAALRRRTADMNVLMSIAVLGGLVLGLTGDTSTFADAAVVIFLDQVGEWLEGWSMRKTSGSIKNLMELTPDVAHLLDDSKVMTDVDVAQITVGSVIRVLAGERVPLDGKIASGESAFNEAAITGESVPVDKSVGATVYAGSLNTTGVVDVLVSAPATSSTLMRVIEQVQGAQAQKAPYESFVDRFAAVYTPLVVAVAAVIGLVVPALLSLVFGASATLWHDWVYRALSLLVVACPCALVISTPVSFVSAITRAARVGILVKGGGVFDVASRVTDLALDKTGTLTMGAPTVNGVFALGGATDAEVLSVAAALEANSTHPLGRAVTAAAEEGGITVPVAAGVFETVAAGAEGTIEGKACAIGKPSFALSRSTHSDDEMNTLVARIASAGKTALVVVCDQRVIGVLDVSDTLRQDAISALSRLHDLGITTTMLTGDHASSAEAIGAAVGVTRIAADLLPEDKVNEVRTLQQAGVVGMVGDGINDAPALVTADLGIAMGAASSDTALEVADAALLGDNLTILPTLFVLARRTMHVVRENIIFAIVVKAIVFVLVIMGVAGMGAAVFADTGVALLVILNGMRLML